MRACADVCMHVRIHNFFKFCNAMCIPAARQTWPQYGGWMRLLLFRGSVPGDFPARSSAPRRNAIEIRGPISWPEEAGCFPLRVQANLATGGETERVAVLDGWNPMGVICLNLHRITFHCFARSP